MANPIQFETYRTAGQPECLQCEELLADAVDAILSEADQTWFDRHISACVNCSAMLNDAVRGAAWLDLLKSPRPEPSADLVDRILAQTTGAESYDTALAASPVVAELPANVVVFPARKALLPRWQRFTRLAFEPRLAMTAAMAFFSIALTMNLTGVRLDQMHASDLNPGNLKRSYYAATASAVRRYDNLRVVHVLESRVDDLRESSRDDRDATSGPLGSRSDLPESRRDQPAAAKPAAPDAPPDDRNKGEGHGVSEMNAPAAEPSATPQLLRTDEKIGPAAPQTGTGNRQNISSKGGLA